MLVYVVFGAHTVFGCSRSKEGAEELMAEQIERVCKNTRDAERQNGKCYGIKATLFVVDEGQKVLTSFNSTELRCALRGVVTVKVEIAGLAETYHIRDIDLVD